MEYILLVRGYASNEVLLWLIVIAMLVVMFGGRWLIARITDFIRQRRVAHLWPFK